MIVELARSWIGTPYRHQQKVKYHGCDCLGLLRGVYEEATGELSEAPPPYTPSWGESRDEELMVDAASRYLDEASEITSGSVLIFRMKRGAIAKHCGIATGNNSMIHAHYSRGVVEENLVGYWKRRIVGIYNFKES